MWQPVARIILRYGVGLAAGASIGDMMAGDRDIVDLFSAGLALAGAGITEWWYQRAKKTGGAT